MWCRAKHIISMALLAVVLVGCDKIRFHVNYVSGPSLMLNVSCEVNNTDPNFFVSVECDAENGTSYIVRLNSTPADRNTNEKKKLFRYIFDLYRVVDSHSEFVERRVCYADISNPFIDPIQFNVSADEYKLLAWCDYVYADTPNESLCYNTDNLCAVLYNDIEIKDNNEKDAFTAMVNVNLRSYNSTLTGVYDIHEHLILERPNGRYKCITTDIDEFIASDPGCEEITAVVNYVQYVASGYSVEEQKPNYFEPVRTYVTTVSTDDLNVEGNLVLSSDYIFVNGKQSNVKLNMQFYRGRVNLVGDKLVKDDGKATSEADIISEWREISVPLRRNMETIITGRLLTTSFDPGGIGINPGFEDEIIIPWE